jgi:hypothetical protein
MKILGREFIAALRKEFRRRGRIMGRTRHLRLTDTFSNKLDHHIYCPEVRNPNGEIDWNIRFFAEWRCGGVWICRETQDLSRCNYDGVLAQRHPNFSYEKILDIEIDPENTAEGISRVADAILACSPPNWPTLTLVRRNPCPVNS